MSALAELGCDALACVAACYLQAVVGLGARYSPFGGGFLSMPKLGTAWDIFKTPRWRQVPLYGLTWRVSAIVPIRASFRVLRYPVVRLVLLGSSALLLSATMRISSAVASDRTGSITTMRSAAKFIRQTEGRFGIVRGAPFAFAALVVEQEIAPLLQRLTQKVSRVGALGIGLLSYAMTAHLWLMCDSHNIFRFKPTSRQAEEYRTPRVGEVAIASQMVFAVSTWLLQS